MDKKNILDQNTRTTPNMPSLLERNCSHWSPPGQSCLLVKDGLFLPVNQHVATYCLTSNYPSCSQYQRLAGAEDKTGHAQTASINRRRSIRVPSYHSFRFSEITGHDHLPGLREDDAWTIDLSDHGIRFASRQSLKLNTDIRFLLEAEDSSAKIEGVGKVVWCEPLEETPFFHAGIVFTDRPNPALLPHHRFLHQA